MAGALCVDDRRQSGRTMNRLFSGRLEGSSVRDVQDVTTARPALRASVRPGIRRVMCPPGMLAEAKCPAQVNPLSAIAMNLGPLDLIGAW